MASSPMHYIGGKVETIDEVRARRRNDERVLLGNMECNGWNRIWTSTAGWKWTQPLAADDVVIAA